MGKVTSSNKPMDVAAAIESALKGCPDCKEPVANERGIATQREALRTASGLEGPICQALEAGSVRLLRHRRLKANVHRLWAEVDGVRRSLIAKRSQPEVARRNWLVAHRWLSIAHLDGLGAPILGIAAEPDGQAAWHVYEDLSGQPLSREHASVSEVEAVLEAIARVHLTFTGHPLLRECRLWGGDRGMAFYSANVNDAISALHGLEPQTGSADCRDALLARMERLREEEGMRRQILDASGGPETLLHGDLWTTNAIITSRQGAVNVRLVDWDEAAVGPVAFDLSTFVAQFDRWRRLAVLDRYQQIVRRLAGWELADDRQLNAAFATVEYARLASLLVWTLAGADGGDEAWLPARLVDIMAWLDDVEPVLPAR